MGEPDDEAGCLFAVVPGCAVAGLVGVPEGNWVGVGEQVEPVGPKCLDDPLFKEDPVGVEHHAEGGACEADPGEDLVLPFSHGRPPPGERGLDKIAGIPFNPISRLVSAAPLLLRSQSAGSAVDMPVIE